MYGRKPLLQTTCLRSHEGIRQAPTSCTGLSQTWDPWVGSAAFLKSVGENMMLYTPASLCSWAPVQAPSWWAVRSLDEVSEQQNSTCPWEVESRLITSIIMFQPCWKGEQFDQERLWVLSFIIRKKIEKTNGKEPSGQEQRAVSLAAMGLGGGRSHTHRSRPILSSQKQLLSRSLAQTGDSPAQFSLEGHWRRPWSAYGQEKDPHFVPR